MKKYLYILLCLLMTDALAIEDQYRFVDLGGKTIRASGETYATTGFRLGLMKPDYAFGLAVYHQLEQSQPAGSEYDYLRRYEFAGLYAERVQYYGRYFLTAQGILGGAAFVEYESRTADTIGIEQAIYFSLEPGISAGVFLIGRFWLYAGASYLLTPPGSNLDSAPALNIYARYLW